MDGINVWFVARRSRNVVGIGATGLTIRGSRPGRSQRFLGVEPAQRPVRWEPRSFMKDKIRLGCEGDQSHLLLGLRMSRATPVLLPYALWSWTGMVNLKWSRYRPGVAQRVGSGIALLFHDHGIRRGWVVSSTPRPHFIPGKTRYRFYRRLGDRNDFTFLL